jgi:hypothetical protein
MPAGLVRFCVKVLMVMALMFAWFMFTGPTP